MNALSLFLPLGAMFLGLGLGLAGLRNPLALFPGLMLFGGGLYLFATAAI